MDIEKAIQIEQKYLDGRLHGVDNLSLSEQLNSCGYSSLEQYFLDKKDYLLKTVGFNIYTENAEGMITLGKKAFIDKTPYIFIPTLEKTSIWHGIDGEIDYDLCKELDIDVYEVGAHGGTIVTNPDDLSLEILFPDNIDIDAQYFLNKFYKFYKKYFEDVVIDNNDILINGFKVQGAGAIQTNGMTMFLTQVSFVDSARFISTLCLKESKKVAGFIDNSILTKDILLKEVLSWLQAP